MAATGQLDIAAAGQIRLAVVTAGTASIGQADPRSPLGYTPELEEQLTGTYGDSRAGVEAIAADIGRFYGNQWAQAAMPTGPDVHPLEFLVAGVDEKEPYGRVFEVAVPTSPTVVPGRGRVIRP